MNLLQRSILKDNFKSLITESVKDPKLSTTIGDLLIVLNELTSDLSYMVKEGKSLEDSYFNTSDEEEHWFINSSVQGRPRPLKTVFKGHKPMPISSPSKVKAAKRMSLAELSSLSEEVITAYQLEEYFRLKYPNNLNTYYVGVEDYDGSSLLKDAFEVEAPSITSAILLWSKKNGKYPHVKEVFSESPLPTLTYYGRKIVAFQV